MTSINPVSTESLSGLPTSDSKARYLGYLIVFVTFGIFGTWATFAPLESAALAPGVVTVQSYRKTVQHLEGGIVKELLARDGEVVSAGDPLIVLDDTQVRAEYGITRSQLVAAQAMEARLKAERDGLEAVDYSQMLESKSHRAEEARDGETQVFNARRGSRLGEVSVLEKRIGQLNEQISGLRSMINTKRSLEASYKGEIGELSDLLAEGFVDKQRLLDQERKLDMLRAEIADHESEITKTRLHISETELQILQLNKDFSSEVVAQLAEVQTRVFDLQERMAALEDRLTRIVIRAPEDGMIIGMKVHTVGGVISPGTPLLDIVPAMSDLIIEAQVSPIDVDRVRVGKPADIRFSAFKSSTTPVMKGEVTHVSADRLINEQTGMPYYLARVALTEEGTKALGTLQLQPGMPAEVLINTGERTMLQYLLQPATDAFAKSMIED
ncbi:HlyD family type I secretion periplasmic adaptor subunit [Pseudomonas stutzeri]|uniref:HlyD family type I secretion periplasmic adaptor subunit n=1 Tax=Stutzerimonas stutzeri TaxID=316 RepID=UPI000DABFACF|nr:HlyD family type I secretion periplasmic adaptor subunit [Stutzerimonas stutzeri]HAJ89022.1 HlyD family type I secretion periplasmic adaptor subunit [Pseudomonas sp.]MCF0014589.1 HlyD family type I secretion periplasmic adaptor subunit [Stutzerimonas stutzeri]MCF0018220.1 HlyD family type I secretion periplasmic adaptor subunit [Stutzerimonas stutzeri]MDH0212185.1 HlyD family type I secretion periplasmic adaptor subunit [Stutzerimonas stutzeri]MDH0258224.1 HlyD family type I secretion perip